MVTLKTDWIDGDYVYAKTTGDNDGFNGITNTINDIGARDEFVKYIYTNNVEDTITGVTNYTITDHAFTLNNMNGKSIIAINITCDLKRGSNTLTQFTLVVNGTNTGIFQGSEVFIYPGDSTVIGSIYSFRKEAAISNSKGMFGVTNDLTVSYVTYSASLINLPIRCLDDDIDISVYYRGGATNRVGYINNTTITVIYG
jgi:hypothetical protein